MTILFKKLQEGGVHTGVGKKLPALERAQQRALLGQENTKSIISSDLTEENEYLKEAWKVLAEEFKNKYPEVDYGNVKTSIDSVNPNFRPEWKTRTDQFANQMISEYGDNFLTQDEMRAALERKGMDIGRFGSSSNTVLNRLGERGVEVPYKGEVEPTIRNWGWRQLAAPLHSVPKEQDRYFNMFD
jgi:hypothetical protein